MENASKALIIAGAILLAILIISLGLVVYNQAKDTVGIINLDQQTMEAYNSKFTDYEGDHIAGSKVNALLNLMISTNQANTQASNGYPVLTLNEEDALTGYTTKASTGHYYTVTLTYTNGLVSNIAVTDNDTTNPVTPEV